MDKSASQLKLSCFMVVFIAIYFASFPIYSQDEGSSSVIFSELEELSLEELLSIEVSSAAKLSQRPIEAPSVISVLTSKQVKDYGWISLNDMLYMQPGLSPSQDFDRRTVSARGMFEGWNNNHLLMLIDGVPMNDNLYGSAYTSEITPLFFMKNVEIIRGPGSALYGSNATNGVLGIKTVSGKDIDGGEARFRVGTANTHIYDVIYGGTSKHFDAVVGVNYFRTVGNPYDSYDDSDRRDSLGGLRRFSTNDERESMYAFAKIEGKEEFDGFSLQFHRQSWSFGTGHGWLWQTPDFGEKMQEGRTLVSLRYASQPIRSNISHEAVARYQHRNIAWNMRYYVDGAFDDFYPNGVWEHLQTSAQDLFVRYQITADLGDGASIVAGIEGNGFFYNGDDVHFANIDMNTFEPYPDNGFRDQGAWLGWIDGNPVVNAAVYAQFSTGKLLGEKLSATIGARYDNQFFTFNALDRDGEQESKSFSQISPRLAVVYLPEENFSLKFLAGRAFRAPAPSELFGANTFSLASNIYNLQPEIITTFEMASDWIISKQFNWRANVLYTNFENQIAYSVANANLSTNVISLETAGIETELLFAFGEWSGFANYSFMHRLSESILDSTISEEESLTWFPAHLVKLGLTYQYKNVTIGATAMFMGEVLRRQSDSQSEEYSSLRPNNVAPWLVANINTSYRISQNLKVSLLVSNVLNSERFLVKNYSLPFDYRMEMLNILAGLEINL